MVESDIAKEAGRLIVEQDKNMFLPESEQLNIGLFSRLFDKKRVTNCYKFFWFRAILAKIIAGKTRVTYNELIDEMIADAWYMVVEYHLKLGPNSSIDNLEEAVIYLHSATGFPSNKKQGEILQYLKNTKDARLDSYKGEIIKDVPYRIHSPFLEKGFIYDSGKFALAQSINEFGKRQNTRLLYYYDLSQVRTVNLNTMIEIDPFWAEYLKKNHEIVAGWITANLIDYLQRRNPSVPGISDKLVAPQSRKMEHARDYWKLVIEEAPVLNEIYGGIAMKDVSISLDHFVPWQYVAHDELWNLHPTTRDINSSKNNSLPDWNEYFKKLARLEYYAYITMVQRPNIKNKFEDCAKYHLNNSEIRKQLFDTSLSESDFTDRLYNVLRPVYDSAKNCGFTDWKYLAG